MSNSSDGDVGGDALWNYAVSARVLRDPAEKNGRVVCPECGKDIEETKGDGDVRVPISAIVDPSTAARIDADDLPTHGWICRRHSHYSVVCPDRPESLQRGWTGILVEFADGHTRKVPIPRREVRDE